jgi:hypothetical protein
VRVKKENLFHYVKIKIHKTCPENNGISLTGEKHVLVLIHSGNLQAEKKGTPGTKHRFMGLK